MQGTCNRYSSLTSCETKGDLPSMPIYYEAWIKYFNFQVTEETLKGKPKPKFFFKNEAFKKQDAIKGATQEDDEVNFIFLT